MNVSYRYRLATPDDARRILTILKEVACEIPVRLNTCTRQKLLFKRVKAACGSGDVWIAVDRHNRAVGFLVAEANKKERIHYGNQGALELSYGGVSAGHREQGIFPTLVTKMKTRGVRLTATVIHENQSAMADRLSKLHFANVATEKDRDDFRWDPESTDVGSGG